FLAGAPAEAVGTALRFTLAVPGGHTAIVGTAKPDRWPENAALLRAGALPRREFEAIRARWRAVADRSWTRPGWGRRWGLGDRTRNLCLGTPHSPRWVGERGRGGRREVSNGILDHPGVQRDLLRRALVPARRRPLPHLRPDADRQHDPRLLLPARGLR